MASRKRPPDEVTVEQPTLSPQEGIKILRRQIERATELTAHGAVHRGDFETWVIATEQVLADALGRNHPMMLRALHAGPPVIVRSQPSAFWARRGYGSRVSQEDDPDHQRAALLTAKAKALEPCVEYLERIPPAPSLTQQQSSPDPLPRIRQVLDKFHRVAVGLRKRHDDRNTLDVVDEYDVQDLLRVLLSVDFEDVRPEEPTPSMGGAGARLDFLLKVEEVVIEAKITRPGRRDKAIRDELLIDIATYRAHPNCKTLVCFVYDPSGQMGNPSALERDLSRSEGGLNVEVYVRPKH